MSSTEDRPDSPDTVQGRLAEAVAELGQYHVPEGIVVKSPDPGAPHDRAHLFKIRGSNALHVVGGGAVADEVRDLLREGRFKGWRRLHPVRESRTELSAVAAELKRVSGSNRTYNLLDRGNP
ncbi:hypothetical protein [Mycobacterium talmoniae]|uniref:Uncharacterized protein n=1 Tax=Mycobacterium talmoniae TaxID=1858794 RepID=A0A1S1N9G3_9MYCO|nr:hypothetical protein [Mycobacterium talmoniae]OHU98195.1 hypothetical protein BKN37_21045 [Mycobacterium talmoniae]